MSKNSLTSSGQKWEIQCAKDKGELGFAGSGPQRKTAPNLAGVNTVAWNDQNIIDFIDSL